MKEQLLKISKERIAANDIKADGYQVRNTYKHKDPPCRVCVDS